MSSSSTSARLCAPPPLVAPPRPPAPPSGLVLCVSALSAGDRTLGGGGAEASPSSASSCCSCSSRRRYVVALEEADDTFARGEEASIHQRNRHCCGCCHRHHYCPRAPHTDNRTPRELSTALEQLILLLRMACCFCCCPVFRCLVWFCAFELITSVYLWYQSLNDLIRTYQTEMDIENGLLLVLLTGWLITLVVSAIALWLAHRKKDAQFVWPRMVQQTGLLVLGFLLAFLLVIYFAGAAHTINSWLIAIYEKWFSDPLTREEREHAHYQLRMRALALVLVDFLFICYISCALCATKKYYRELLAEARGNFQRVSQYEPNPTAPRAHPYQPPMNPHYKGYP